MMVVTIEASFLRKASGLTALSSVSDSSKEVSLSNRNLMAIIF
jgi:hypothetical protein